MTWLLLAALKKALEETLRALPLATRPRTAGGTVVAVPPRVCIGDLPPKSSADAFEAPAVVLQALEGFDDTEGWQHITVALRCIVWNDESVEAVENDLANLLSMLRWRCMQCRTAPLDGRFALEWGENGNWLPWKRPDAQAPQFGEAYVLTHWRGRGL